MIPSKLDLTIWRGITFELELVSQVKNYTYDPAVHNKPADLKRTHAENLEYYGFTYEYVDFFTLYAGATLDIIKPWRSNQAADREPLLTLSTVDGTIELTSSSVKVGLAAEDTREIEFDEGTHELLLTTVAGKVDGLIHGAVTVQGDR